MDFFKANMDVLLEKKPRLVRVEDYTSPALIDDIRGLPSLAVAEVAGRDSIAAALSVIDEGVENILPTVVYTGTEFGDWRELESNLAFLSNKARERGAKTHPPVVLGDPRLWAALGGAFSGVLTRFYGPCGPCTACHLYMHICRVPLALAIGSRPVVGGERESHEGRIKINQTPEALDAYRAVLSSAGIELMLPIRRMERNSEIESLVGSDWREGDRQLSCVLSRNYQTLEGGITCDRGSFRRYLSEFLVPVGEDIVKAVLKGDSDYSGIVRERLALLEVSL
ncbi:MAG: hypothetical protein ACYC1U_07270 [Candidatus Aquicultorales bacterium]